MGLPGTTIRTIFQTATSMGAAFGTLCQMSGVNPEEISDSEHMVEWEKGALIWVPLLKLSGDPLIGLHIGMSAKRVLYGMFGFLIQSSKDVDQALQMVHRYGHMQAPMIEYRYTVKEMAVLEIEQNPIWVMKYPEPSRQAKDFLIAIIVTTLSSLTGKNIVPVRIELTGEMREISEYRKHFGCEVLFNKDVNRIILSKEDISTPILTSDQSMFQTFSSIVADKQALLETNSTSENLKQVLFMQFKGRIPTIEEAASALNMTPRNLQRKLLQEQTTFRDIAGEIRKEIAFQLMQNPAIKITEVSDILGYSDLTAFRKAFKSWTNATPREVRKGRA
ncbi:AraC family transcriptional regulator [Niastella yeongjuensis]|uniref:AraC family transcriptional regulator n=1 Tax=Niastella yeongjuensis TaxID=354355 RepID=A0A1V9DXQ5_9BACT|nr:AraC family transcriptional regulator [Niastella yeongjuensis]OQP38620.1 AraC family transcriptional regulator [Niastella yeongjuensis]SEO39267.1 Helix-turn-helix domain-containing protein [Niastella yeongjuensis]